MVSRERSLRNSKIVRGLTVLAFLFLFSAFPAFAVSVPELKGRVNDYAKIIRDSDEREIEEYLYNLEQSSGIQLAVLTMPSLGGDDIASFGYRKAACHGSDRCGCFDSHLCRHHDIRRKKSFRRA